MELYLTPLHTPIGTIFVCLALVQLFHRAFRMDAFKWLYGGCLGHFALDLLQATINGYGPTLEPLDGYHWLYPLSWFDFQIGVFWTEDTPWSLILLVPLSIWACFGSLAHRSFLISQLWPEGVKVRERPKE
jgi:hypothetical protein